MDVTRCVQSTVVATSCLVCDQVRCGAYVVIRYVEKTCVGHGKAYFAHDGCEKVHGGKVRSL